MNQMKRIPDEKIREIQAKADIVSVISKYTKLQKKGQDYLGLCLFHSDNSPSMSVSPTKRYFKCFSCGVGGNVFEFLMKYKHIGFVEAVVELAKEFNVELDDKILTAKPVDKYNQTQKTMFEINNEAMKFYQVNLNSALGADAKKYLNDRQIDDQQIKQWEVGYAIDNDLLPHLQAAGYTVKQVVDAGLATQLDNGVYDYFKNRIVFPIKNQDGYIIGFSGRILTDEKPKYLNTRETLVFKKSEVLFNLNNVWNVKDRVDSIILLEGFMDVISLEKVGINNSMALMGTNFSNFHLKTILNLKKPVKLFLDGDLAGVNAMYKIAQTLIKNKVKFSIIDNISNQDPDELVNHGKAEQVVNMINKSVNPYQYFLNKFIAEKTNLTIDETDEIIERILELLADEPNYILVDQVLTNLSQKLQVDKQAISNQFTQKHPHHQIVQQPVKDQVINQVEKPKPVVNQRPTKFERGRNRIFISLLKSDQFLDQTIPIISQLSQSNFSYEKMFKNLVKFYQTNQYSGNDLNKFFALIKQQDFAVDEINALKKIIEDPNDGYESEVEFTDSEFKQIINKFQIKDLEKQFQISKETLKKLEAELNDEPNPASQQIIAQKILNNKSRAKILNDKIIEMRKESESN